MECYPRAAFILLREFSYAAAELREPLRLSRSCVDSRQLCRQPSVVSTAVSYSTVSVPVKTPTRFQTQAIVIAVVAAFFNAMVEAEDWLCERSVPAAAVEAGARHCEHSGP
jgi:hypothetical protein